MTTHDRNISFDLLKGIGILLMMWCHLTQTHSQFVYSFHIPLFFLISGYYAKTSFDCYRGGYSHTIKNINRLVAPYAVTMLILCLWGALQALLKHHLEMACRYPLSILWAGGDPIYSERFGIIYAGPLWFLLALFWMREIFFYGAGCIISYTHRYADEIVVGASIVLSLVAVFVHSRFAPLPWCLLQGLAAIEFYAIGWYAHRHTIPMWLKVVCIVCWLMAIRWGNLELSSCYYGCYPLDVLGACGATMILYRVCQIVSVWLKNRFPNSKIYLHSPLQWIGRNSLAILCMHTIDLYSGAIFSIMCRLPFSITGYPLAIIRILIAIILAALVTHLPILKKIYR